MTKSLYSDYEQVTADHLSHLHRLKISHTDECPCGTGPQTPEHLLQYCPTYKTQREDTWEGEVGLEEKLLTPKGLQNLLNSPN